MKVFFTKKQYGNLVKSIAVSSWVYGIMSDMVDEKYKDDVGEIDDLENYLLSFYKDFSFPKENVQKHDERLFVSDDYNDQIANDIGEFNEFEFWDGLFHRLAEIDFERKFTDEEIENMEVFERIEHIYKLEENYRNYFSKNGLDKINIPF